MSSMLRYISHKNVAIELDGEPTWSGGFTGLRSRHWSTKISLNTIISAKREAREITCPLLATNPDELERMEAAFDADMTALSPGKLIAFDGWSQRAYATQTEVNDISPTALSATVTFVLLDGVWRKEVKHVLKPDTQALISGSGLDYPHDFDFDLGGSIPGKDMDFIRDSKVRITFFGPCQDPYVRIGSNLYGVKGVTVAAGERVVIDPTLVGEYGRAIRLVGTYGAERNLFSKRIRGAKGSGSYAFEPVEGGYLPVSWPQTYGIDIDEIRERGGLPWS